MSDETGAQVEAQVEAQAEAQVEIPVETQVEAQPAQTERPEWLLDKFVGDDAVEQQAKSYNELQKKMGEYWGAPKDDYTISEELNLASDDPIIEHMKPKFKEMGLSDKGFESLAKTYLEAMDSVIAARDNELKQLRETMGPQIDRAQTYIKNALPENEAKALMDSINDPTAFAAIDRLIARAGQASNNIPSHTEHQSYESVAAIRAEKAGNWSKYMKDQRYREEITKRERRALAAEARR